MAVCETKLSETINLSMQGYNIVRRDRNRHGGGVLLVLKNTIDYYQLKTEDDNSSIEKVGI